MLNSEEQMPSEDSCYEISHNWFIDRGKDLTLIDSISLGKVLQLQIFEKLFIFAQINKDGSDIKSRLKMAGLEWPARALASLFSRDSDRDACDFLLVYDVNNDPMIQALNIIGNKLQDAGESISAVTVDYEISRKCSAWSKISWYKCSSFKDFWLAVVSYVLFWKSAGRKISRASLRISVQHGRKRARSITRYFFFQSLFVFAEVRALNALLNQKKPKVVILASDAHRVSRIFSFLCKKHNVKTVVYQHGATIWKYGYIPVFADYMMTWGRFSREWFYDRGVDMEKLIEIGNIRLDTGKLRKLYEQDFSPLTRKRKVYFFQNPIDRKITSRVIDILLQICSEYGCHGIIKLHPSEKNVEYFEDIVNLQEGGVTIRKDPIPEVGIVPGDVAIVINSTAGIDCCMLGAYIFNVDVPSMPNPIDYEGFGVGVTASLDSYITDFDRLLTLPAAEYLRNREAFLHDHLGSLDGKSADRALDFVIKISQNAS